MFKGKHWEKRFDGLFSTCACGFQDYQNDPFVEKHLKEMNKK